MTLPFLKAKQAVGVIVSRRGKRDLQDVNPEQDLSNKDAPHRKLIPHAEDLIRSLDERSVGGVAKALHGAMSSGEPNSHENTSNLDGEDDNG